MSKAMPCVRIIATGTTCLPENLEAACALLHTLGFDPRPSTVFFENHPLFIASDAQRLANLKEALYAEDTDFIWCLRGGYGASRLLPALLDCPPPVKAKTLMGFSDITALHLFVTQKWGWQSIHGPTLNAFTHSMNKVPFTPVPQEKAMQQVVLDLLHTGKASLEHDLVPLNHQGSFPLTAPIMGGNLALCQRSVGTPWQLEGQGKILFFEDINETPHRVSEMLDHLTHAGIFRDVKAVVFGDFTQDNAPERPVNSEHLFDVDPLDHVLKTFAEQHSFPVFKGLPVGHNDVNFPVQLNKEAVLLNKDGVISLHQDLVLLLNHF